HAPTPSQEVPTIMPRRRRGGWALSPWPARSGLLAPREVILPTSHPSRAEGPRPTLPRAHQASFPARPPWAPVPRPGKRRSKAKVVAVPSGSSRRMPRGASGGERLAHHQQAGHPPQGTTSSRDGALARERVPWRTRLIYGSGDLFGGGAYNIINFYYLIFLTDVAHVRPALAGIIVLASRIWDAVSDPLMGSITDRTRSRFGRRRPYFLAGSVLIFLAFALHWYAPAFASETARFAYALFSYIFFATVFTLVMVPYSARPAEITLDYHERTRLNSVRLAFSL